MMMKMSMLPDDCVCKILSLTSAGDACTTSLVSSAFRSAAECDLVWERFLPSGYPDIVSRSASPLNFSSLKDLYFRLCNSIIIDGGNKIFKLEQRSGKISYIICATELSIMWSKDSLHWIWKSVPESRFSEVAILKSVCQLEIQAQIQTRMLSQNTTYGAYLIIKIMDSAFGLDSIPSEISLEVGNQVTTNTAYLRRHSDSKKQQMECLFYKNRMEMLKSRIDINGEGRVAREREDGWMEIELGEFLTGTDGDDEVKMSLKEVKGYQLKGGLMVEGIEVRPKCY